MAGAAQYDVVIAGGGMVGASLSLALASIGQRVAVVEAVAAGSPGQPSFDDRATALSNSSRRVFDALGVWPEMAPFATPIRRIHVSDQGRFGMTRIDAREEGVEALGFMVRNRHIGKALHQAVSASALVDYICPASAGNVVIGEASASIEIARPGEPTGTVSGRLLVAADGARSKIRTALGIGAGVDDYGQVAIIANVAFERPHDQVAFERFTEDGPLAILPMSAEDAPGSPGGRATVVWTVAADRADGVLALGDDGFMSELQRSFGFRLGRILRAGRRQSYPLALVRSSEQVRHRVAVAGNAAHSLHPVAGQGFNLSLRDVAALAECVADAVAAGEDPGSLEVLHRYRDWRERDQRDVVRFSDGLIRVFTSRRSVTRLGRNAGLVGMELLPGAKRLLARQTMGVAGRLPRLARGVPLT